MVLHQINFKIRELKKNMREFHKKMIVIIQCQYGELKLGWLTISPTSYHHAKYSMTFYNCKKILFVDLHQPSYQSRKLDSI